MSKDKSSLTDFLIVIYEIRDAELDEIQTQKMVIKLC